MSEKIKLFLVDPEKNNMYPICPHCEYELKKVGSFSLRKTFLGGVTEKGYMCLNCRKVLGFSNWAAA